TLSPGGKMAGDATSVGLATLVIRWQTGLHAFAPSQAPSTASLAETWNSTRVPSGPSASTIMSAGTDRTGACRSVTLTMNAPWGSWPASGDVQETRVSPLGHQVPLWGTQVMRISTPAALKAWAGGLNVTRAPSWS